MIDMPNRLAVERMVADWSRTSPEFAALVGRYGDAAPALRHLGVTHWQAGRFGDAAEMFRSALVLTPCDPLLWRDLAGAYEGAGDDTRALLCIKQSIEYGPSDSQSWLMRAGIERHSGDAQGAEAAYRQAIALDPQRVDAHVGLGLLCFERQRFDEAIASLSVAVQHAPDHALAQTCLGQALYTTGDFVASAASFAVAAELTTLDALARHNAAYAHTLRTMIEGRIPEALDAYPHIAGEAADDISTVAQDAFRLLSAYGYTAAAAELGRLRLARDPSDPVQRYLLDAVRGEPLQRAPADYIERYFDGFASTFEQKLVGGLGYRIPERLTQMVAAHRDAFSAILDLGCGTGLAADHLARFGGRLTGLDLSAKMLDEARKRGCYAELLKGDAVALLQSAPARFDLVFAADLLIYLGDLAPIFAGVARCLVPDGMFALSIETAAAGHFALLPSGRFAHAPAYVEALANPHFDIVDRAETVIRLEGRRPVDGRLFLLRRR